MRIAFNFYRSYYDVFKELSDKDKLSFIAALLEKQFEGKEPDLKGMANFAYLSQKHSIDAQVIGYETKTKEKLNPTVGGRQGGGVGASVQGQEEGKEKVEQAKASKHLFTNDLLFDKVNFKAAFPEWSKEKLAYYYGALADYSAQGNMYKDWAAAARAWARKDDKQGKIKFDIKPPRVILQGTL